MDWGRAKSVLIMSFLMLNVLLGFQLFNDIREQLDANVNSAELPQDKLLLMQQKRITFASSVNLPSETPKLGDLTYLLHSDIHQKSVPTPLEAPIDSALNFNKGQLIKAIGGQVPDLEHYVYDLHNSREGVFVLHRMVDGLPMFNVKLELYNSNLKITGFLQDRVELVSRGEEKQVLPASKVVASLIETYLQEGSVIADIQLGYHGQIFDSEKQVSAPSWRVMLDNGTVYYVNAISGEVATDGGDESNEEESEDESAG